MNLTDRISLLEICNREFPGGIAVEVGVAGGHFARQILDTWKTIGMLHLVDPWKHFTDGRVDGYNLDQKTQDARYADLVKCFENEPKVEVMRMESMEVVAYFWPEKVHFCYIDANHSYEAAKQDVPAWWMAIKSGGILAGHDYYNSGKFSEVKKAVDEFAEENKLTVHSTRQTHSRPSAIYGASWEGPSWAIRKP